MARPKPSYERLPQETRPPVEPSHADGASHSRAQVQQQADAHVVPAGAATRSRTRRQPQLQPAAAPVDVPSPAPKQVVLPAGEALMTTKRMQGAIQLLLPPNVWDDFGSQIAGRLLYDALLGGAPGSLSRTDQLQRICLLPPALQGASLAVIAEQAPTVVCRHADPADKGARPVVVFHGSGEVRQQVGQLLSALASLRLVVDRQEAWERHSAALHRDLEAAAAGGLVGVAAAFAEQLASRRVPLLMLHYQGLRGGQRFAVRRQLFVDCSWHGQESYSTKALCLGPEVPLDNGWLPLPSFLPASMCHTAVPAPQGGGAAVAAEQLGWTWQANDTLGKDNFRVRDAAE